MKRSASPLKRRLHPLRWACALLGVATLGVAQADEKALATHISAAASTLGARERSTLDKIPQLDRRLLALRSYVRVGSSVGSRWSWTNEEIRSYERSSEYRVLLNDLDRVRAEFERQNPGYTLYANTQVRSLDLQLERWNTNPRVGTTAASLRRAVEATLARHSDGEPDVEGFKHFLASWRPAPAAPLAAPGLSAHGRMRAVDFQIMRAGRIVAATDVGAVSRQWEATGWDRKLKRAILASRTGFEGPLKSPNEPWHYEYRGAEATVAANRTALPR